MQAKTDNKDEVRSRVDLPNTVSESFPDSFPLEIEIMRKLIYQVVEDICCTFV